MDNTVVYLFLALFATIAGVLRLFLSIVTYFKIKVNDELLLSQYHQFIQLTALSFLWYSISLSFTLYNKWIMQVFSGGFSFPMIMTAMHMIMKTVAARIWSCSTKPVKELPWKQYATIAVPIGVLTAADIVFANASIMYLPLSLYTTIKGSSLIFTFLWGVACRIEKFDCLLFSAVVTITIGIGMAVSSTLELEWLGVLLALSSSACGGLRWVLLQVLVEADDRSLKSPMTALYHFTLPSAVAILPFALLFEAPRLARSSFAESGAIAGEATLLLVLGGFISLLLILVEVVLLQLTSSLTLGVIGQIKEIIQILIAMVLFDENIRLQSGLGIGLSIVGSWFYKHVHSSRSSGDGHASLPTSASVIPVEDGSEEDGEFSSLLSLQGVEMVDSGIMKPMQIQVSG